MLIIITAHSNPLFRVLLLLAYAAVRGDVAHNALGNIMH